MTQPYLLAFVGGNANGMLRWWTERIVDGFRRHGLDHRIIDLEQPDWRIRLGDILVAGNPTFCFSFQGFGMDLRLGGGNYWAQNGIPFLSYLGDNPYHSPSLHAAEGEGLYLLYGCEDFLETYRRYLHGRTYATMLRYGYPENPAANRTRWTRREHGVVFVKTGVDPAALRDGWAALPAQVRAILEAGADHILSGADATIAGTCAAAFGQMHIHWGDRKELFLFTCSTLDRYIRAVRAERMVLQLMRRDAVIIGDWSHLDTGGARARFRPSVPAHTLDALYAASKIVANTSPSVRRGMHERIMAGLFAKSAVLSDTTPFLDSMLADCPSYLGLDIDSADFADQVQTTLDAALRDPAMPEKVEASHVVARTLFSLDDFVDALFATIHLEEHRRTVAPWSFPPSDLQTLAAPALQRAA